MLLVGVRSRVDVREIVAIVVAFASSVFLLPGLWSAITATAATLSIVGGVAVGVAALGARAARQRRGRM